MDSATVKHAKLLDTQFTGFSVSQRSVNASPRISKEDVQSI
jgi:hypothetical protein